MITGSFSPYRRSPGNAARFAPYGGAGGPVSQFSDRFLAAEERVGMQREQGIRRKQRAAAEESGNLFPQHRKAPQNELRGYKRHKPAARKPGNDRASDWTPWCNARKDVAFPRLPLGFALEDALRHVADVHKIIPAGDGYGDAARSHGLDGAGQVVAFAAYRPAR